MDLKVYLNFGIKYHTFPQKIGVHLYIIIIIIIKSVLLSEYKK